MLHFFCNLPSLHGTWQLNVWVKLPYPPFSFPVTPINNYQWLSFIKIKYWQLACLSINFLLQLSLCHYCRYFKLSFHFQRFYFQPYLLPSSFCFSVPSPLSFTPFTFLFPIALPFHGLFFLMKKEGAYSGFSKGESSSGSAQGKAQEVVEHPAFPLRDS